MTIAALVCAAVAAWLSGGALTLLPGPGAARAGVLPPLSWLAISLGAAVLIAWRLPAKLLRNSWVLLLSALIVLPWLPIRVPPAFLIWAGPAKVWVWTLIVSAIVVALAAPALAKRAPSALASVVRDPRRAPWLAAVLAASLYIAGAWLVFPRLPAGDEPHYLVIAQSLLRDHDIQVGNNYLNGDYHEYYRGALQPHYLRRGLNEAIYSVHAPGLPALVAPVFALSGYPGVLLFLSLLSACGSAFAWTAAWRVTEDAAASWFGWAVVALSAPFVFQAFTVYPDAPGGALLMVTVVALTLRDKPSTFHTIACGATLAVLPWLHTRFAVLAAVAGLVLARRLAAGPGIRRALALLSIPIVSAIGWFAFFYLVYGTPNPAAPYNGYTQTSLANLSRGLPGLLIDQQFGLLANAPACFCALLGFWPLFRRTPRLATELLAIVAPYVIAVAAYQMWWAGYSSPARFLAPVLLPLSIPAAVWFASRTTVAARTMNLLALASSLLITATIALVDRGALLFNARDGASRLLLWLSPLVNLTTGLPSLFQASPASALLEAALWLLAILATAAIAKMALRDRSLSPAGGVSLGGAAALMLMVAVSTVWRVNRSAPLTPATASAALRRDGGAGNRPLGIRFAPFRLLAASDVLLASSREQWTRSDSPGVQPIVLLQYPLAATYELDAAIVRPGGGLLTVTLDREFGPAWSWSLPDTPGEWRRTFTIPIPATGVLVAGDAAANHAVDRVALRAVSLLKNGGLIDARPVHTVRYGPAVVLLVRGHVYMETGGAWIAGASDAEFAIQPDPGHEIQLFLRNAPVRNRVTLESGSWREELALMPREERLFTIPADPDTGAARLHVSCAAGIRPSDIESSEDTRLLGCWLETR
jgi:hypothetical protein